MLVSKLDHLCLMYSFVVASGNTILFVHTGLNSAIVWGLLHAHASLESADVGEDALGFRPLQALGFRPLQTLGWPPGAFARANIDRP